MLRNTSKQTDKHYNITSALSRLRGSLTQYDNPSTDRVNDTRKRCNSSVADVFHTLPILRSNSEKKQKGKQTRASSLKRILKGRNSIQNSRCELKSSKMVLDEEFKESIGRLDHKKHTHVGEIQCFLDFRTFITIMSEMNYLGNWKEDSMLMDEMWKQLGGEDYGGFLRSNLLLFLYMVEGVGEIDMKVDENKMEKKKRIYFKYEKLRNNRTDSKSSNLTSTSDVRVFKEQEGDNLRKLRKSLITRDNKPKKAVVLKKKGEKEDGKQMNRSVRVSFKLDVNSAKQNKQSTKETVQSKETEECTQEVSSKKDNHSISQMFNVSEDLLLDDKQQIPISVFQQTKPRSKRIALLSLDINLGQGKSDKIIIYEGDTPKQIAESLAMKHLLNKEVCGKFEKILESHLNHLLSKIQQVEQLTEDMCCSQREI